MANNVQATGRVGSTTTPSPPEGFAGWSPEDDPGRYTLSGAATPAQVIGAWVTATARAKGDLVTNGGKRWRAKQAMTTGQNASAPSEGAFWTDAEGAGRKGVGEPTTSTTENVRVYR